MINVVGRRFYVQAMPKLEELLIWCGREKPRAILQCGRSSNCWKHTIFMDQLGEILEQRVRRNRSGNGRCFDSASLTRATMVQRFAYSKACSLVIDAITGILTP